MKIAYTNHIIEKNRHDLKKYLENLIKRISNWCDIAIK